MLFVFKIAVVSEMQRGLQPYRFEAGDTLRVTWSYGITKYYGESIWKGWSPRRVRGDDEQTLTSLERRIYILYTSRGE